MKRLPLMTFSVVAFAAAFVLCAPAVAQEKDSCATDAAPQRNYAGLANAYFKLDDEEVRKHLGESRLDTAEQAEKAIRKLNDAELIQFANLLYEKGASAGLIEKDEKTRYGMFERVGVLDLYHEFINMSEKEKKLLANAAQGDARAQYELGMAFLYVVGYHRKSACWIRKAAKQGYAQAQYDLGEAYARGSRWFFVDKDKSESVRWYHEAAWQGHAASQRALSVSYLRGEGIIADDREAYIWLLMAKANGETLLDDMESEIEKDFSKSEIRSARKEAKSRMKVTRYCKREEFGVFQRIADWFSCSMAKVIW